MEESIKEYKYGGRLFGRLIRGDSGDTHFEPCIEEFELFDLIREMNVSDQVHMERKAFAVFRLLKHYGHNPKDCLENESILIHLANLGHTSRFKLQRQDTTAYDLVTQRGLLKGRYKHRLSSKTLRLPKPQRVSFEEEREEYGWTASRVVQKILAERTVRGRGRRFNSR